MISRQVVAGAPVLVVAKPKVLGREPVLVFSLFNSVIAAATAFGLDLTADQTSALMATVASVLSWIVRSQVSPAKPA
jgi:hypothetical protein